MCENCTVKPRVSVTVVIRLVVALWLKSSHVPVAWPPTIVGREFSLQIWTLLCTYGWVTQITTTQWQLSSDSLATDIGQNKDMLIYTLYFAIQNIKQAFCIIVSSIRRLAHVERDSKPPTHVTDLARHRFTPFLKKIYFVITERPQQCCNLITS